MSPVLTITRFRKKDRGASIRPPSSQANVLKTRAPLKSAGVWHDATLNGFHCHVMVKMSMLTGLTRFIEHHPSLHRASLAVWRCFPPRLAGFLKGIMARNWLVGAVAVIIDENRSPPEVLLVEHSYRRRGAWGLPGGSLESTPGDPKQPGKDKSPDDVIEAALRREVSEELGIAIKVLRLLRIDAIPYIPEEPGPHRLDFYFRCAPLDGFEVLRERVISGQIKPRSPEIKQVRFVALNSLDEYDLFSPDLRLLREDLPRLEPNLNTAKGASRTGCL
jgi:8-oxo-dGTP pyrophosphatase MutT (NUDIX family)